MSYPQAPKFDRTVYQIKLYAQLKHEYGARGIEKVFAKTDRCLKAMQSEMERLPIDKSLARKEPDALPAIRALRPPGPRRVWKTFDAAAYPPKLEGALLARTAGCTLGAIVEGWEIKAMENWAKEIGDPFPPVRYWSRAKDPKRKRYAMSLCSEYTLPLMNGVPVDDDIAYTLLGLLILEEYGPKFTTADVGKAWVKYLPLACTAEEVALNNLKAGIPASKAALKENPYVQWIGADIRSDPWGWLAPGWPQKAAEMAYRDACLSHRRNGIYGEMFFAAAQAAAFATDDPIEAIRIGLTEIPKDCTLAHDVRWALREGRRIGNFRQARAAVDRRFKGMHIVHTNNNACLTIFGLMIGGRDVTKVISQTVAMGMDNDCTAATAGSIVGAVVGKKGISKHWYAKFNNTVRSYLIGKPKFRIDDLVRRFTKQSALIVAE